MARTSYPAPLSLAAMVRWFSVLSLIATFRVTVCRSTPSSDLLHVSAIVGIKGASAFQCWAVEPPFLVSQQPGTVGAKIASLGNISLSTAVFFNETHYTHAGLHNAPQPQWVAVLKGKGKVTLPTTNKSLSLPQGALVIATDTADVSKIGHNTTWSPGTLSIQMPFKDGVVPTHIITNHLGPCPAPHH